jgi:hypothetical protein
LTIYIGFSKLIFVGGEVTGKIIILMIGYIFEFLLVDVDMSFVPAMGSSRSSGGLFRGRARGNIPKHADLSTVDFESGVPVKGEVHLYLTEQYPHHVNFELLRGESDLVVIVNVTESMAPILNMVAHKFSPIRRVYKLLVYLFILTLGLDEDFRIYARRSTKWIALGQFDQALGDDDGCEWQMSEDQTHELHLLIVSLSSKLCFGTDSIYQSSYNGPTTGSQYVPSTISKTSGRISTPIPSGSFDLGLLSDRQNEFMTVLDMDKGIVGKKGSPSSLEMMWKRYVAITKAISVVGDVDWASGVKKPSQSEIISVYGGKSTFYEQSKVLQHVKNYPDMVEWLERTESNMDASTELWGFYKAMYVIKDLGEWIEKKEAEKGKGKGKGKKKVSEPSTSVKKSHKKSGVVRKQ